MATTPTWALPYPVPTDPPAGHTQLQGLATTVDTTLATLRTTDSPPWCLLYMQALTLPTNTAGYLTMELSIQHTSNIFSLAGSTDWGSTDTTIYTSRSGLYQAMVRIRGHAVPVSMGQTGYMQVYFESPVGAQFNDMLAPTYGTEWQDIMGQFMFRWEAGKPLAINAYNNTGQTHTFVGASPVYLAWVAV